MRNAKYTTFSLELEQITTKRKWYAHMLAYPVSSFVNGPFAPSRCFISVSQSHIQSKHISKAFHHTTPLESFLGHLGCPLFHCLQSSWHTPYYFIDGKRSIFWLTGTNTKCRLFSNAAYNVRACTTTPFETKPLCCEIASGYRIEIG